MQNAGLSASEAAARVIEISKQVPAPIRAPVGKDAEEFYAKEYAKATSH